MTPHYEEDLQRDLEAAAEEQKELARILERSGRVMDFDRLRDVKFVTCLVGPACVLAVVVYLLFEPMERKTQRQGACTKVLDCLDEGVSREHCDAVFPNCRKMEAP